MSLLCITCNIEEGLMDKHCLECRFAQYSEFDWPCFICEKFSMWEKEPSKSQEYTKK